LLVVVSHRDSQLPTAKDCPPSSLVNRSLGTHVSAPTAVSESDLLGCFYQQGSDDQAVFVSFAARTPSDEPCHGRRAVEVSGDGACDATGSPGTSRSGASLVVEAGELQDQFSSDLRQIPLARLEQLAVRVLAAPPPPVHGVATIGGQPSDRQNGASEDRSATDLSVDQFPDQVGVAVVAGVFLDNTAANWAVRAWVPGRLLGVI